MKHLLNSKGAMLIALTTIIGVFLISCGDDDGPGGPTLVASYSFVVQDDGLIVDFTNDSQGTSDAATYAWNFGDGSNSTEENPTHSFSVGTYTVTLTVTDGAQMDDFSQEITIQDANVQLTLLAGESSKTWIMAREESNMVNYMDAARTMVRNQFFNDGSRPCYYDDEFIFHRDGTFEFDANGTFWAEFAVFNDPFGFNTCTPQNNSTQEQCLDISAATMKDVCGNDVSAWGSATHTYTFDASANEIQLMGTGAWIGFPRLGTNTPYANSPTANVNPTFTVELKEDSDDGVDTMFVRFDYPNFTNPNTSNNEPTYMEFTYVSYDDATVAAPALVAVEPRCDDQGPAVNPNSFSLSFEAEDDGEAGVIDAWTQRNVALTYGVTTAPASMADPAAEFVSTAGAFGNGQELRLRLRPDQSDPNVVWQAVGFDNADMLSVEVYFPSTNDYSGDLERSIQIGIGQRQCNGNNWNNDYMAYTRTFTAAEEDAWQTITIDLSSDVPEFNNKPGRGNVPADRDAWDMMFIRMGDDNSHDVGGTFYIRNLTIN